MSAIDGSVQRCRTAGHLARLAMTGADQNKVVQIDDVAVQTVGGHQETIVVHTRGKAALGTDHEPVTITATEEGTELAANPFRHRRRRGNKFRQNRRQLPHGVNLLVNKILHRPSMAP